MTLALSGTNGLLQSYDRQVLTTGFSYTFAAGTQVLIIEPAGTLATGTITMPASPADGMTITVESTQQVTALTMSGNGGTIVGTAVQLIPNQPLSWVYRLSNTTWYPLWGGAGRASALVSGTSVASTSGTSIDFTSIPSWVKRITVMFNGVSTNGSTAFLIQLGTGATPTYTTSGYSSYGVVLAATSMSGAVRTDGFPFGNTSTSTNTYGGSIVLTNVNANLWSANGFVASAGTVGNGGLLGAGSIDLGALLTAVRIRATNGTDVFDAGSINILFE